MKVRKTFAALFATVCSIVFVLLATVFVAAACSKKVTLRFETGSGTHIASVEGQSGREYQKPQDPYLDGYYFDGWFLDPSFSGEPQTLPDVMPSESTTYYAKYGKYPILTLCTDEGIEFMHLKVKPGVNLSERLKDIAPEKTGLIFGGWTLDGEILPGDAVMGEEDMTLTARYKASYSVNVYLQLADDPEEYERDPTLSFESADWVETEFGAQIPTPNHFHYVAERSSAEGTLQAGTNVFNLYFDREEFIVTLDPALPEGGGRQTQISTRYGAHLSPEKPEGGEGYSFLGWREEGGDHEAGEEFVLTGPIVLKGIWAESYSNALGEGTLYAELEEGPVRRAVYEIGGERFEGEFNETLGTFSAGPYRGKLEPHGGFLPDDSGTYLGCDLKLNEREELGKLTLDFFGGSARYECGEISLDGKYAPLYDDEQQRYTGEYELDGAFRFRLYDDVFLREGAEKGSYLRFDYAAGEFQSGTLILDGYGNAVLYGEKTQTGRYFHGEEDWNFVPEEGDALRFLLGGRSWYDGDEIAEENGFLLWSENLAGVYNSAESSLTLDGYGVRAVYRERDEERTASFTREENVITLFFDPVLRFTLKGETFSPTSEEEGHYEGELGTLYLDGAGGAVLYDGNIQKDSGKYEFSGGRYAYEGGSEFFFRLNGKGYDVYDSAKAGTFENYFYETALLLDGFGGGKCFLTAGEGFDVRLLYKDEGFILLFSESFNSPRRTAAFRIDGGGHIVEIQSVEAGIYPVCENGEETQETLLLDGMGSARLLESGMSGEYSYSHTKREVVCHFKDKTQTYLLTEKGGVPCCQSSLCAGDYVGEAGTLSLDGYGGAVLSGGEERPYLVKAGAVELDCGEELLRFTLGEGAYTLVRFRRYTNPFGAGTLYLGRDSISAILRGEKEYYGTYGLDIFLSEGKSFSYRIKGDEFFVYDETQKKTFETSDGDSLSLDGCGFGTLTIGGAVYEGNVFRSENYILFSSAELPARKLGYRLEGDVLVPLGEECGLYPSESGGSTLFLRGDGTLILFGDERVSGEYVKVFDDVYEISIRGRKFRVGISAEEGTWALWEETLSSYKGSYSCGGDILYIDGCHITLVSGEERTAYRFFCACEGGFLAENVQTGACFRFRFGQDAEISPVEFRFFVREI